MGRPLKGKTEAESVGWRAVTLHRVDDFGVQEKEFRAGHDIGIHVTVVPRHLYAPAAIKPEKQNFPRQHVSRPCLEQQVFFRTHIVHIPGQKHIACQSMFVSQADGIDEKGKRDNIVLRPIGLRSSMLSKASRRTKSDQQQPQEADKKNFFHLLLLSKLLSILYLQEACQLILPEDSRKFVLKKGQFNQIVTKKSAFSPV